MDLQDIEKELLEIIPRYLLELPPEQPKDMQELARAGEPGVAFENLCTQLYEYDVPVSRELHERLAVIGSAMGIKPEYWERLAVDQQPLA